MSIDQEDNSQEDVAAAIRNRLLGKIAEDTAEKVAEEAGLATSSTDASVSDATADTLKPGEVLFRPEFEGAASRTALANGTLVDFPLITADKELIKELQAFADHCGTLEVVKG